MDNMRSIDNMRSMLGVVNGLLVAQQVTGQTSIDYYRGLRAVLNRDI